VIANRYALAGFPLCWLGLAGPDPRPNPDLSVNLKSQILSTCKSTQILITSKNNTNNLEIIYIETYNFTLELL
jgi:hypothetical protein